MTYKVIVVDNNQSDNLGLLSSTWGSIAKNFFSSLMNKYGDMEWVYNTTISFSFSYADGSATFGIEELLPKYVVKSPSARNFVEMAVSNRNHKIMDLLNYLSVGTEVVIEGSTYKRTR